MPVPNGGEAVAAGLTFIFNTLELGVEEWPKALSVLIQRGLKINLSWVNF